MRPLFLFLSILLSAGMLSQSNLNIDKCLDMAKLNYPLQGNYKHIEEQMDLHLKNMNANYYPQLDLNAQASYQNDVPHITSSSLPFAVPMGPKDQYKATIDVQQVIFDAGRTKAAKEAEKVNFQTQQSNLEVELYKIRSKVIDTYFLILSINEQIKLLDYKSETIKTRLKELNSGVTNGMILLSQVDQLKVELLTIDQEKIRLSEGKKAAVKVLETFIGQTVSNDVNFDIPLDLENTQVFVRPEYQYFDDQRQQTTMMQKITAKNRLPYLSGFGQVGYGNPGFNMLKDEFVSFYMVGLKLKWNIWDWHQTSRKKQYYQIQNERINTQQSVFEMNTDMASENVNSQIIQLEKIMEKDDDIIELRKRISTSSASQLSNGAITAADYITDLNAESIAILSQKLHSLELAKARIELNDLKGAQK